MTDQHQSGAQHVPDRLPAETYDLMLGNDYACRVSLARDPATGQPVEIVLKPTGSAGKSGGSLDLIFFDLGVALSRALQGRDPSGRSPR
jgi:hypothetical protein